MKKDLEAMRLDKWLWAARFYKTRSLAQKEIELGRILVNGLKVKNSKIIQLGDIVDLQMNRLPYRVRVIAFNLQRRPAVEACTLYQEDLEIKQKREEIKELNKSINLFESHHDGRPSKRDRRKIDAFKKSWN